jgi:hypothetical protein
MKRLMPALTIMLLSLAASAQYKKAGFLDKEGRTYELGTRMFMFGDGKGNPMGFHFGYGRDRGKTFGGTDFHYIPSFAYSYKTEDDYGAPVNVDGKSQGMLIISTSLGLHFLKNEDDRMFDPYAKIALSVLLTSGVKYENRDTYAYTKRNTSDQSLSAGIGAGLGCHINFSPKWGLKLEGGTTRVVNFSADHWDDDVKPFYLYVSHMYVDLGLRLRIMGN